jgi:hypothetical protein
MAERHLLCQFSQAGITDGAVDILGPCVVKVIAGRKFEGCKTGIKSEMEEGLGWEGVQSVDCKAERMGQG